MSIFGSADGATWGREIRRSVSAEVLCRRVSAASGFERARRCEVCSRALGSCAWGRGIETPMFEFGVTLKEVPADILREAKAEAKALA